MTDLDVAADPTGDLPLASQMSRVMIRSAMDLLVQRYGLHDHDQAFDILKRLSQRGNVKLRAVAAHLLVHEAEEAPRRRADSQKSPKMSFSRGANYNRTAVLVDLMAAMRDLADAPHATVQSVDPIGGGLVIDGQVGFSRPFLDHFSYVEAVDTACGSALVSGAQFCVDDVAASSVYDSAGRDVMLGAGARSVVSTPLRDDRGHVVGVVSTHHPLPGQMAADHSLEAMQKLADQAGRWLRWYDCTVMPVVVTAVHAEAAGASERSAVNE